MGQDSPEHMGGQGPSRRSNRLKDYDYAQAGAYFLTICTSRRACLLGEVLDGAMVLNRFGRIVEEEWLASGLIRREITLDRFVVMPNHVHGIVFIAEAHQAATANGPPLLYGPSARSVGAFVAGFKSAATSRINTLRSARGTRVWQRNYYEHVIRDRPSLDHLRQYICSNPTRWQA